jgi:glycosyltransferase involved in cell wall biosynthesis
MNKVKVSVIIPVFNCEEYLQVCLRSVVSQTFREIEIIVVNDASTDGSKTIIDDFAKSDGRFIHVSHKKNKGVSAARNTGIDKSRGEYILFLDADDYWDDSGMVGELYKIAKISRADMTTFGYHMVDEAGNLFGHTANNKAPPSTFDLAKRNDWCLQYAAWSILVPKKLLNKHKIRFNPDLVMGEDALFCYRLYCYAATLTVVDRTYYSYRMNKKGANNMVWSSHKMACTVLWFQAAIHAFRYSPSFNRKPELLQALIHERLTMLVNKLGSMATSILNDDELKAYVEISAVCFSHLDHNYFNARVFPNGWPPKVIRTLNYVMQRDIAGFRSLYSDERHSSL